MLSSFFFIARAPPGLVKHLCFPAKKKKSRRQTARWRTLSRGLRLRWRRQKELKCGGRTKVGWDRGKQSTGASFSFSFTSLSLSVCHAAAPINIIHCCLMLYYVVPDQQGQAEHLRMLCSFTVCNLERCVSNRSSKVRAGHKDYSRFLPSWSERMLRLSVLKSPNHFLRLEVHI